ncbi:serine/threonine-protein kinase [Kineococcus sp. SYSU DK004]|uniref:hypothetical protein n=1 Tax=Kineococcus sp. SYSU DK004 TaxID=3383125 RepID=UPI003D7D919E
MSEDEERVDLRGGRSDHDLDGSRPEPVEPADPAGEALFDAPDAEQARVRELLRAEGARPLTLPDDVAARLQDALAAARAEQVGREPAGATVASLGAARGRRGRYGRRWQRALAVAAGVTVLAGGAVAVDQLRDEPATSALTERVPASTKVLETGQDVANVAVVRDLAEETLDDVVTGEPEPAPDEGAAAATGPRLLSAPEEPAATSAEDQRPAAERVLACTRDLGVATGSVVSVTFAAFRGDPAAVVVHRTGEEAEAVVVPADCRPGDEPISRVDVPVPDGGDTPTSSDAS